MVLKPTFSMNLGASIGAGALAPGCPTFFPSHALAWNRTEPPLSFHAIDVISYLKELSERYFSLGHAGLSVIE